MHPTYRQSYWDMAVHWRVGFDLQVLYPRELPRLLRGAERDGRESRENARQQPGYPAVGAPRAINGSGIGAARVGRLEDVVAV